MKILVVYYSLEGNTQYLAESLVECVGAEVIKLKPVKDIKNNALKYLLGGRQASMRKKPELEPFTFMPEEYDLIIIGTPVWAGTMTPAIRSFLHNVTLANKKIGLFCCYRGSQGKAIKHMKKLLHDSHIIDTIHFREPIKGEQNQKERICEWARHLIKKSQKP